MSMAMFSRSLCILLAALPLLSGCGSDLPFEAAMVKGTVSYQGKPLDHGQVVFVPKNGTAGPQAVGEIQADGCFTMRSGTTPGVAVGSHRVTVHCRGELPPEKKLSLAIPPSLIPEKYSRADTTPLSFEVKKGEENVFNITLD